MVKATKKKFTLTAFKIHAGTEKVETIIDGVLETTNTATSKDFIVCGTKGEKYVMSSESAEKRYVIEFKRENLMCDTYTLTTKPIIIDCKENKEALTFTASWGEEMNAKEGDYLVYENDKLSYSIDKEVFFNTYELKDNK